MSHSSLDIVNTYGNQNITEIISYNATTPQQEKNNNFPVNFKSVENSFITFDNHFEKINPQTKGKPWRDLVEAKYLRSPRNVQRKSVELNEKRIIAITNNNNAINTNSSSPPSIRAKRAIPGMVVVATGFNEINAYPGPENSVRKTFIDVRNTVSRILDFVSQEKYKREVPLLIERFFGELPKEEIETLALYIKNTITNLFIFIEEEKINNGALPLCQASW